MSAGTLVSSLSNLEVQHYNSIAGYYKMLKKMPQYLKQCYICLKIILHLNIHVAYSNAFSILNISFSNMCGVHMIIYNVSQA